MKTLMMTVAALTLIGISGGTEILAQTAVAWRGGGGWGPGTSYGRMYNPQTVETLRGAIVAVDKVTPMKGMSHGVHVTLKTDTATIAVHLGPGWYIENQDVTLAAKDTVEVRGSRITLDGKPAIIAAEIKKDEAVMVLRDDSGFPVWSGWRRR